MASRAAAALALALLALPVPVVAGPQVRVVWLLAPEHAPGAGEPVAFGARVEGPPGLAVQLRAWLGGEGARGAQVWVGASWERSDRYALDWRLDGAGRAEGWLVVRASDLGAGPWALGLKVRDAREDVLAEAKRPLRAAEGELREVLAPGAVVVGAARGGVWEALAPAQPYADWGAPWAIEGFAAVRAPLGAELRVLDARGSDLGPLPAPREGTLRLSALLVEAPDEAAEFVRVRNEGAAPEPLAGWRLAGAGWEAVLQGGTLAPGHEVALARNVSAYEALTGRSDAARDVAWRGAMRLANGGGRVELSRFHALRDAAAWGRAPEGPGWTDAPLPLLPQGFVHHRLSGTDTDTAADFAGPRRHAGWGARAPFAADGTATVFGRGDALATALAALDGARREVLVEVYQFTSPVLAGALQAALARGARVRVLVEGAPVGGVPAEEGPLLAALQQGGAEVLRIGGSGRDRYGVVHAKFAVLDRESVLLGSENWTPSGFPESGGNLGWGAWVRAPALAQELARAWEDDASLARADVARWPTGPARALPAPPPWPAPASESARATLLLAPDNAGPQVLALAARAGASLDVQALQLPLAWSHGPNPVVGAMQAAAARGVRVRVLLDGAPGSENGATARALDAWAAERGLALEARLHRDERVHNKAMLVDGREALVGSVNFGEAAMTVNREAALVLEGPVVTDLARLFEGDWAGSAAKAPARAEPAWIAAPVALLAALAVWRGRRR